ncbi:MAG: carboxypeptidase regulatory-like domain-containing protein, partial [Candidatus Wildermuthbacteria bacterium]|nr:carboxypeptidase regulatory-like domain-containing protein [Candidatus Wildermuthbacteria bacterium]
MPFSFGGLDIAHAAVTAVTGADNDTTGFGIDGRDFAVTWTNDGNTPAGYTTTKIFVLSAATADSVTAGNILINGCGGNPCQERGFFSQYSQSAMALPQFSNSDSEGNNWNALTSYKACVFVDATSDELTCSSAFSVTSDAPSDSNMPFVDHMPVYAATESADAIFSAVITDDQTTGAEFVTPENDGLEFFKIFYGANVSVGETAAYATQVNGNLFQFTVPSASVPVAGGTFEYYLNAKDKAGNTMFFCANPAAASAADCKNAPFVVNTVAAGERSVAGTIRSGGNALSGAYVYAGGYAKAAVTTNGSGAYSITGLPNNNAFDITAYKQGYCRNVRFEVLGTSNLTGIDMNINQGECGFATGGGGGTPQVMFSGPFDGAFGVPSSEKIRVGVNQAMNAQTINDSNAADAGSNVYLTTDDGTTKVAGAVVYCESSSTPGCSSIPSQDTNTILFSPTSALQANTFYTFVITEAATSTSGQSIQSNRAGGGHKISFTTGGSAFNEATVTANFGSGGQYMPPFVRSMIPGPGVPSPLSTSVVLEFSDRMNTNTITTSSLQLWNMSTNSQVTLQASEITVDSNEQRVITINPASNLAAGEYEVRVKGSVAAANGMSIMPPNQSSNDAFSGNFVVSSSVSAAAPTVFPLLASGSEVAVNEGIFEFGFSDPLLPSSVNTTNITMKRGSTNVAVTVKYDPGTNSVFVIPTDVSAPSTTYTITFTASGVTTIAGTVLASAASYTYTTGSADTVAPKVVNARCDDNTCAIFFTERMNQGTQVDANYATSILKPANITVDVTSDGAPASTLDLLAGVTLTYDSVENNLTVKGLSGSSIALTSGSEFLFTVNAAVTDLSGNAIGATNNTWRGKAESSANTFGSFGSTGMFGPPMGGGAGTEFKAEGFGSFTSEQFAFGQTVMAFPFNQMAGQDSNVFQARFSPGVALQNDDQIILTFPSGTGVTNAAPDTFSPFYTDMNEFGSGTVVFDTALDSDGVSVDATARQVTVQLAVTGTPGASDYYTIDLRNITNPAIPKGPETGGYTVDIKVSRAGTVIVNKTSMPYFIAQAGSRSITINLYAGSQATPDSVSGSIFMFGGGPSGPQDKNITITNGTGTVALTSLPDGCYFFGTEPFVIIGGNEYFGQHSPEPVCVDSTNTSRTKNIVLSSATSAGSSVPVTVKFAGISNFGGVDIDIFAGGPGNFVVKTLSGVTTPAVDGYTLRLPQNGTWFVGVGPAMPKGPSATKITSQLPGVPPPPVDLIVSGLGGTPAVTAGRFVPPGAGFNDTTDTLTLTFATADKSISGTVTDGTNPLQNVEVFMHAQGFGAPAFATTNDLGAFTISVSDYGTYEIGAMKSGLPPTFQSIEILADGSDAGTDIDIFFKGKQITGANPLILKLKKPSYSIAGKVLDAESGGSGIAYVPVFGTDANGNFVSTMTDSSGNYTLFVDAGTWTVRSELPPSKSDTCGTLSKSVTITTESKSSQNITPSTSTCVELSGTVSVGGTAQANIPIFIDEWDTTNSRPVAGGVFKGTSTNSSGVYTAKVAGNKTYRIGTFDPSFGDLSTTKAVVASNISDANITVATTDTITFAFTGGTSSMGAFVELKKSTDKNVRIGKQYNGLNSNLQMTVQGSTTYNYFVDVFGFGTFNGSASAGDTVTLNVSTSSFLTLSGNVKDGNAANSNNLSGVLVTAKDTTTGLVKTALTDSNGDYSMGLKAGTYTVSASKASYIPAQAPATLVLSANTSNYDFGGASGDQLGMVKSTQVITGTVYESNGSTAMTEGFVTATNSSGLVVTTSVDSQNGVYSLPVSDGTWTISAKGPRHTKTAKSGTVTIAGADSASGNNITLTADNTKVSTSESKVVAANIGGALDATTNSGVKVNAGGGVLESGSGNVTIEIEKAFTAPDTLNFTPLADASFDVSASGTSTVKNLTGTAELQIDYTSMVADLPAGVSESDLKFVYYSPERGEYVPVEGGFTVDTANNIITAQTTHFTSFSVVYSPVAASAAPSGGAGTGIGYIAPEVASVPSTPEPVAIVVTTEGTANQPVVTETKTPASAPETSVLSKPISQMTTQELLSAISTLMAKVQALQAELQKMAGE